MRSRWMLVAVLVALAVGCGCYPQPAQWKPWTPVPVGGEQRVVLFGDSLAAMAESVVMGPAHAVEREGETWSYNAVGATRVQHWLDAMAGVGPDDVVVFELLTNNVSLEAINTGELPEHLHQGLAAVSAARCVVVFTLNTTGGDLRGSPYGTRTRWVNTELRRAVAAGEYPNVVLLDWEAESAGRVDWLVNPVPGGDYLHYNTAGNVAFASAIARAPGLCA